ncbi:MAG: sigma-70 family RNA polymerase sigma factor [Bacteroidetes bacterium]|nr:sigma-70 family RNA polymerase sigma factor [Bacteroidota bacterium]
MLANRYINIPDEELLVIYNSGRDNELLGVLLQRYTLLLLGVAMKYLKDKDEAQDAVQQVFLKAITHLPQGEIQNFKGWLYVLMRNHCLQLLRDKHYLTEDSVLANLKNVETDKEELIWKDATLEQMNDAIGKLDEEQKKSVTMFYLEGLSYKQITEQTGYSFEQVKSYIQNGKRMLKQILTKGK